MPRVVLMRYKVHNKGNNIETIQQKNTYNAKSLNGKQKICMNDVCENKTVLHKDKTVLKRNKLKKKCEIKAFPIEKSKVSTKLNISENVTVSDISLSEISKMIDDEGSYQEKKLHPVTAVATNKCKITNIDTINTKFIIRGHSCIDDVKGSLYIRINIKN
ncbi:uncharacterized protein [Linepithema humile]|uniref:uncharacterized protein n=1 Tax=Linepithema humile TaxID=83485 RepID=UPI00351F38FD